MFENGILHTHSCCSDHFDALVLSDAYASGLISGRAGNHGRNPADESCRKVILFTMKDNIFEGFLKELLEEREQCIDQLILAGASDSELVAMGFITDEISGRRDHYAAM